MKLSKPALILFMLDNMDYEEMKKAVQLVNGQVLLEASGNIDEEILVL
jgi:nicotinate-nucleotide pyrophosphorylase (carboxylating)